MKWIKDLKSRPKTRKLLEENKWEKLQDTGHGNDLLEMITGIGNKNRNRQMGLHQTTFVYQRTESTVKWMGENICKSCSW